MDENNPQDNFQRLQKQLKLLQGLTNPPSTDANSLEKLMPSPQLKQPAGTTPPPSLDLPAINSMLDKIETVQLRTPPPSLRIPFKKPNIFLVHGHNEDLKNTVARSLEKLNFKIFALNEQTNTGKTIIEKIERYGKEVNFAVVSMTPDDEGRKKGKEDLNLRARQNVIFELGYFIGRLGRAKVVVLFSPEIDIPEISDLSGVLYIPVTEKDWYVRLAKELKEAGFNVDLNRIL